MFWNYISMLCIDIFLKFIARAYIVWSFNSNQLVMSVDLLLLQSPYVSLVVHGLIKLMFCARNGGFKC